ncbi:MAG TPA: hypothetical protein PKJ95_00140 [Atribacterota bacterium]|nr:hypothetical protein [Atribacterota bacterium]
MVSFIEDIANVLERHGKCKNMPAKKVAKFIESSLRALDKVTGQEEEKSTPKKTMSDFKDSPVSMSATTAVKE